jgi:FlaA1/EpsC-like NDP-sugar epimerase
MITLRQAVEQVWFAFEDMKGSETYVKKIPSMNIVDIAQAIAPNAELDLIGIRPGEKLHEQMISSEDAPSTYEYPTYYKILPQINEWHKDKGRIKNGTLVAEDFVYNSQTNSEWMTIQNLQSWLNKNSFLI